jgi:MFS family permease
MAKKAKGRQPRKPSGFAVERSHRASHTSNEHSRATAQTSVLINGGAATAMIAFLAKEGIDPGLSRAVPLSLGLYAAGVLFGALMFYFATETMDRWNLYWEARANNQRGEVEKFETSAGRWWWGFRVSFVLSVLAFVAASVILALALNKVWPPVESTSLAPGAEATDTTSAAKSHSRLNPDSNCY